VLAPGTSYSQQVPDAGLDVEKLGILRRWGAGLQADPREEVAAAGRAITLLIDEIERLHVLIWDRRLYPDVPVPPVSAEAGDQVEAAAQVEPAPEPESRLRLGGLRGRLRGPARRSFPQDDQQAESRSEGQVPEDRQQAAGESDEGPAHSSFPV
jgi:hypothetical protein